MASHRRHTKYFSREKKPRIALIRGLMGSLVEHGRIKTTVDRAKEVRRHIEKAITVGKGGGVAATRLLMTRLPNKDYVHTIVNDISVRFKTRPGGYTRVIKIGRRPGDTAEMAFLEFVDYDFNQAAATKAGDKKEGKKVAKKDGDTPVKKAAKVTAPGTVVAAKKKARIRMQKISRAESRG